jgi:ribosomal protein L37E
MIKQPCALCPSNKTRSKKWYDFKIRKGVDFIGDIPLVLNVEIKPNVTKVCKRCYDKNYDHLRVLFRTFAHQ